MAESRRSSVATQRKESVASRKDSIASRKDSTSSRKDSSATDPFKDLPIVWIIGGPGSGRSTQCQLLSIYSGLCHVSSGVTLKKEIMAGSIYSKTLYDYIVIGECVPNATMAGVIKEEMLTKVSGKGYSVQGFVMDGYPMNSTQAATFVQMIGPPTAVILLDVPAAIMNERCKQRKNFDDSQESIYRRIEKFTSVTMPLVRKWNGITVDGTREPSVVFNEIKEILISRNAFVEKELDVNIH